MFYKNRLNFYEITISSAGVGLVPFETKHSFVPGTYSVVKRGPPRVLRHVEPEAKVSRTCCYVVFECVHGVHDPEGRCNSTLSQL